MKIEYKKIDKVRGIVQVTCPDERWYSAKSVEEMKKLKLLSPDDFYPSVTWIASYYPKGDQYVKWVANKGWDKAEEVKNDAGEKGSRVHNACDDLMKGTEVKMDSQYPDRDGEMMELTSTEYGTIMTFRRFLEVEQPIILGVEYVILNHEYKFGGTVDIKCRIKSDNYEFIHIIDIKTSKDIWMSHKIQISAYKNTDLEAQKIDILQVGYNRNKIGYKLTPIDDKFGIFLSTREIWKEEQSEVMVPQREYPLSLKWDPKEALKNLPDTKVVKS